MPHLIRTPALPPYFSSLPVGTRGQSSPSFPFPVDNLKGVLRGPYPLRTQHECMLPAQGVCLMAPHELAPGSSVIPRSQPAHKDIHQLYITRHNLPGACRWPLTAFSDWSTTQSQRLSTLCPKTSQCHTSRFLLDKTQYSLMSISHLPAATSTARGIFSLFLAS